MIATSVIQKLFLMAAIDVLQCLGYHIWSLKITELGHAFIIPHTALVYTLAWFLGSTAYARASPFSSMQIIGTACMESESACEVGL